MGEVFYRVVDHYVSVAWGSPIFVDIYDLSGDFFESFEVSENEKDVAAALAPHFKGKARTGLSELAQTIAAYFQEGERDRFDPVLMNRFRVDPEELLDVGLV